MKKTETFDKKLKEIILATLSMEISTSKARTQIKQLISDTIGEDEKPEGEEIWWKANPHKLARNQLRQQLRNAFTLKEK